MSRHHGRDSQSPYLTVDNLTARAVLVIRRHQFCQSLSRL